METTPTINHDPRMLEPIGLVEIDTGFGGFDGPYNKVSKVDSDKGNPCGEIESQEGPTPTRIGMENPLRFLADMTAAPSLFNRIPAGRLMKFVGAAGWKSSQRRQYALSCAGKVELWRLAKHVIRDRDIGDQVIPWGERHKAPARVRQAAQKLQELATFELAETFRDAASPETKAAFVDMLRGVFTSRSLSNRVDAATAGLKLAPEQGMSGSVAGAAERLKAQASKSDSDLHADAARTW